jgi:hypothetical protein
MVERTADGYIRTTEWEDIQYKHGNKVGNYATREAEILGQRLMESHADALLMAYDPNAEKVQAKAERGGYDTEPGGSVDDVGSDEDDALAALRRKRMLELQRESSTRVHGTLRHIAGSDYVAEITDCSATCPVVAVMVKLGHEDCDALLQVMRDVARKYPDVKFVSLIAEEAVHKFPEKHLPCVVVYQGGKLITQLTELAPWKEGTSLSVASVVKRLERVGIVPKGDDEDGHEDWQLQQKFAWRSGDAIRHKR